MAVNEQFLSEAKKVLPASRIIEDITRRRAFGTDASFYHLVPDLVLKVENAQQMQQILISASEYHVPVTFRAAGTSLSGQAVSDSVLIMLSEDWTEYQIEQSGQRIRLQPGIVGADANKHLLPFERKIGPDPASINSCKIGGIAANNASGMCCGVSKNSYYSLADMTIILADGTIVNSADKQSVEQFRTSHSHLLNELDMLAKLVKTDKDLSALIRHKYRLKNTTGYAINALVDFDDPFDILMHLMIGSEGTLGFIADITYKTVPDYQHKASGLYSFANAQLACNLVAKLTKYPVEAVELLDQRAIRSVQGKPGLPDSFCEHPDQTTALLIETRAQSAKALAEQMIEIDKLIAEYQPVESIPLTTDRTLSEQLWAIRKATFPAVGAVRETGTTVIIEDVSFPIEHLAEGIEKLHEMFDEFGYNEAIIFGHALAGNVHFVFTQSFESQAEIDRYDQFMHQVSNLVAVEYGGSLKAEHGTGRNMAPFVELEWGRSAYAVMKQIKAIVDPLNILNPGVILNEDKQAHIKNLKALPEANDIVDKCIECGFCEPVCPSKDLTLTPRQRIALWRRIQQLNNQSSLTTKEEDELKQLKKDYQYLGIDSCAATGMCAQRCPVGINTGDLVRELRGQQQTKFSKTIAKWTADNFATTAGAASLAFKANGAITKLVGDKAVNSIGKGLHKVSGKIPLWHAAWPAASRKLKPSKIKAISKEKVIFFASCASRTMGPAASSTEKRSLTQVSHDVLTKAGYDVIIPNKVNELCCGMPYHSKGMADIASAKGNELINHLR